jgi:hypothetical protein
MAASATHQAECCSASTPVEVASSAIRAWSRPRAQGDVEADLAEILPMSATPIDRRKGLGFAHVANEQCDRVRGRHRGRPPQIIVMWWPPLSYVPV